MSALAPILVAAARELCRISSTECCVDNEDNWKTYGEDFLAQAEAVLTACGAYDMMRALIVAREFVSTDRNSLADTCMRPDGTMEADDAAAVGDYDAALLQIDAAIAKATGSAS